MELQAYEVQGLPITNRTFSPVADRRTTALTCLHARRGQCLTARPGQSNFSSLQRSASAFSIFLHGINNKNRTREQLERALSTATTYIWLARALLRDAAPRGPRGHCVR